MSLKRKDFLGLYDVSKEEINEELQLETELRYEAN